MRQNRLLGAAVAALSALALTARITTGSAKVKAVPAP